MFCPLCGSDRIRRSHTTGFEEKLLKFLGFKAFRCREELCDWRGLLKIGLRGENDSGLLKKCKPALICLIMLLLSFLMFVLFINSDYIT